ncbi:transcription initiation factor IID [Apiospora phragmitis]|uniref:Transcription initiation factor TFIID subunit 13 n=1 Tax=Apiospora phragmitis TaxID=2905665 RepID=A0ABR1WUC2_9PEZI
MEPRARAGKNVGKETFAAKDLSALMYAYGDVPQPLPDTVRVMDEIMTEFLEGVCFEASQHAQYASRQKLKFDDFEFSLPRNPQYLGRVAAMVEKRKHIKEMRRAFQPDDDAVLKSQGKDEAGALIGGLGNQATNGAAASGSQVHGDDELLGLDDDDEDIMDSVKKSQDGPRKKRKIGGSAV